MTIYSKHPIINLHAQEHTTIQCIQMTLPSAVFHDMFNMWIISLDMENFHDTFTQMCNVQEIYADSYQFYTP